ncbi:cbb3-type cytochrome C oxidase subunit 3 [Notoacmeibacter marinus]|uniref:Cbb3-type cytochrome C oxidase subunit 3 n=1 Tax=Notoacmeibacter marinus TaxID=1876515 RepID=A0A231V0U1_9HYPH|nr:cbb3-type cytochrome c oxidase subunit 3 [Notoacmeibacter marinus]OXT01717.1 cbb3-type cytochrome C oxidase subunit 3 [Notoacmeibacter marinus]
MEFSYDAMRQFADSWGLLGMMAFFFTVIVMVLWPGARSKAEDAAQIPFKED